MKFRFFVMYYEIIYQLDLRTPGNFPSLASSRKQILHNRNFLINPRFLPHFQHRRTIRVLNFGFLFDFAICPFVAIVWYLVH